MVLQIPNISTPVFVVGDEALHLQGGLWIYYYIDSNLHKFLQIAFWGLTCVSLLLIRGKMINDLSAKFSRYTSNKAIKFLFILLMFFFLAVYFLVSREWTYHALFMRDPHFSKVLYFITYIFTGINHYGPRMLQVIFCMLGSVYLYRIINLFRDKETALLGASIYLFAPVVFFYSGTAELSSGLVFFFILISFHFIRYLKDNDNRDLILTSFLIGLGFFYKRNILIMVFICCAYLVLKALKNKDLHLLKIQLKVLLLSLIPIIPWLISGKFFNFRNAGVSLYQFASFDIVTTYFLMIQSQITWWVFFLFLFSILFVFTSKRDSLSFFMGFLFIGLYIFYTSQAYGQYPRFSVAFYPTVAVFMAQFITGITHKIRWKHSFKIAFSVLIGYLIVLSTISPFSDNVIPDKIKKSQYFPNQKAMRWVKDNVNDGERILSLRYKPDLFYSDRYGINKNNFISFWYEFQEFFPTPKKLKEFCRKNNVSYILFPDGPSFLIGSRDKAILDYLKENKNNEFIEAAKFNLDENYIYIYELKEIHKKDTVNS
jgi:hypothetical protein